MHRILINPARMQTKNSSEGNLVLGEYSKPFLNANYKFQFLYDSKKKCKIAECWYHNIKKTLNVDIIIESLLKLHHAHWRDVVCPQEISLQNSLQTFFCTFLASLLPSKSTAYKQLWPHGERTVSTYLQLWNHYFILFSHTQKPSCGFKK